MAILENFYYRFQRKTNTVNFIPAIDGLRFLAVFMVLLFHLNIFLIAKVPFDFDKPVFDYWWLTGILNSDRKGVFLFFVISGFILALPFARSYRGESAAVNLKSYFKRRLTRLEPPYILAMLASFFGILMLSGHEFAASFPDGFFGLFPRLLASLVYLHNIIFPKYLSVNPISWSLEIEVQFYVLVPLLVKVFALPKIWRRGLLVFSSVILIYFQHLTQPSTTTLFNYLQYFLAGFLLADLYLDKINLNIPKFLSYILGLLCLVSIAYIDLSLHDYWDYIFPAVVLGFYFMALNDEVWKKLFSFRVITAIGGMCYSIYLLHYNLISIIGNKTIFFNVSNSYPVAYLWQSLILLPLVLLVSGVFYLLIERPCMDKDWPVRLWNWTKKKFSKKYRANTLEI